MFVFEQRFDNSFLIKLNKLLIRWINKSKVIIPNVLTNIIHLFKLKFGVNNYNSNHIYCPYNNLWFLLQNNYTEDSTYPNLSMSSLDNIFCTVPLLLNMTSFLPHSLSSA